MRGFRNWSLGIGYMITSGYICFVAGAEHVAELGGTLGALGVGVGLVVGLRAANKFAENGNREVK